MMNLFFMEKENITEDVIYADRRAGNDETEESIDNDQIDQSAKENNTNQQNYGSRV